MSEPLTPLNADSSQTMSGHPSCNCSESDNWLLQAYKMRYQLRRDADRPRSSTPSKEDTSKMMSRQLHRFAQSSGGQLQISETGKYSVETASGEHRMEVAFSDDLKTVTVATVVHKVNHKNLLVESSGQCPKSSRGAYSLMTKMMKYNAMLGRGSGGAGRVCAYDGIFVFFSQVNVSSLVVEGNFQASLESILLRAVEISKDFATTEGSSNRKKHMRRRRFLVGAYNQTGF